MTPPTLRRLHLEWLACVLAALGFATVLQHTGVLERIDLGLYDTVLRIGARPAPDEVLIVAIDASSLADFGRWPWPRARHAELLERLAEAAPRAVALDLLFVEPDADPATDARLAQAMARLRERTAVWLPVTAVTPLVEGRPAQALRPLPLLEQAASGLGHIDVELDADAVVRSLFLREGTPAHMWPSLAGRLAGLPDGEGLTGADSAFAGWHRQSRQLIPFSGPAGHYRSVPYAALVRGEVAPQFLRDKLVLVGITSTGVGDHYPTPFSAGQGLVPGVEINAAALDGLLSGRMITPLPTLPNRVIAAALLLAWMTLLWRLGPRTGLAGLAAAMVFGLAISVVLQTALRSWWPPASCLAAMLFAYMLWSWRRLTVLFADLHRRAGLLGGAPDAADRDGWQQVVVALDVALEARRQRNDTLQLLSHDLRAPQSAILALLHSDAHRRGEQGELHQRIDLQVRTTLALADDFILQMRAESDAYVWREVELGQLLHEVRERALPLAQARGVTLTLDGVPGAAEEDEGHWVRADPRLLDRVLFNLVENAVKYSPSGTTTRLSLGWRDARPGRSAVITLRDEGRGIAAADLPLLFERYSRFAAGAGEADPPSGHGLGLWLVKTVLERHGGRIACDSAPGVGTTFVITLPEAPPEGDADS